MSRKGILIFGLVLTLFAGCARAGDPEAAIDQAVGYLNNRELGKWIDLWVPENREPMRKELVQQPEDEGLKNIKTAKLVRRVDITGKIPINPNYPFVEARIYFVEMDLEVKKETPAFKNGRNKHLVLLLRKTPEDSGWAIRQWMVSSGELEDLLKPRKMEPPKQPPQAQQQQAQPPGK